LADNGKPKVHRRYLLGSGKTFGLFVHNFVASEAPTVFHDHPWTWGLALVIRGGYIEERCARDGTKRTKRWLGLGRMNLLLPGVFHRVELRDGRPAWTVFVHGRKVRRWGFLSAVTGAFHFWSPSDARCL
jgi:hypothetical protein